MARPTMEGAPQSADPAAPIEAIVSGGGSRQTLEQVVADGQARIEAAKPKGRGRPRKDGSVAPKAGAGLAPDHVKVDKAALAQALTPTLALPYWALAQQTGIEELELTDDEAKKQGEAAAEVMAILAPTMDPKSAAILGLVSTAGTIAFSKYLIYQTAMRERAQNKRLEGAASPSGI